MAGDELEEFYVHEVTVRPVDKEGPWGREYAAPSAVRCFVSESRVLVRDGTGSEVVSEAQLTAPLSAAPLFDAGALVRLPTREATVIKASRAESGDLDLPDHVHVALT